MHSLFYKNVCVCVCALNWNVEECLTDVQRLQGCSDEIKPVRHEAALTGRQSALFLQCSEQRVAVRTQLDNFMSTNRHVHHSASRNTNTTDAKLMAVKLFSSYPDAARDLGAPEPSWIQTVCMSRSAHKTEARRTKHTDPDTHRYERLKIFNLICVSKK